MKEIVKIEKEKNMSLIAIQNYHNELQNIKDFGGSKKETAIRNSFYALLNEYAKQKGLMLIAELTIKSPLGNNITPDGTLKDSLRLDWGYWESKDEADDIDLEIEKKFAKGYPKENILFEDSQTAVLYQNGMETARIDMKNASALDKLIKTFVNYERPEVVNFRKAIELFKSDIPNVANALRNLINDSADTNKDFTAKREEFHETCKQSINPEISLDDINEMMIQHILTADIFNTIIDEPYFHRENNIAEQLERVINTFFTRQIRENLLSKVNMYYQAINATAAGIADHHEKQKFLKIVYENFYKSYNPKAADRLGVVYTPNEIVRFMIESTDYLLHKHFGRFLADKNVEILDPATGTGTFICDIIDYLPKDKLEYKYKNEIHANEVAILPYYIANLNIEFTYKQRMGKYEEFQNLCFVDTLDNMGFDYANKQSDMFGLSAENTERIKRQNERKISVIIGNPPYNANQANENDNNKNREYPIIDKRIKDTYIKNSTAHKTKLYDMYSRFYRWAMDRLGDEGVIAFVTNRSFINSRTFDGFRKTIQDEFNECHIIDTQSDVRANPKIAGTTHNVFGIQTGVAVMFLVKNKISERCKIYYHTLTDEMRKEEKWEWFLENKIKDIPFVHIQPDKKNNWLDLTDNDWDTMMPVALPKLSGRDSSQINSIFTLASFGTVSNRDEWVFDFDNSFLKSKLNYYINYYDKIRTSIKRPLTNNWYNEFDSIIKWTQDVRHYIEKNIEITFNEFDIIKSNYRPYIMKQFYNSKWLNWSLYKTPLFFNNNNKYIAISGISSSKPFQVLSTKYLFNLDFLEKTQCLPLYRYDSEGNRIENITDWGLEQFHNNYDDKTITKEDIFHYVYAVLHNPEYRKKYEMNLKREFPRIPFYEDFWKWAGWGKKLMDLHINFETIEEYPLIETSIELNKEVYKPKLKANKDDGTIELDNQTTLSGIPNEVWEYKLGNRSALEWILDQYKEKKPKDPTIAEKFNTYRFIDYKDKVIDLLKRVTTVSVETVKIVEEMRGN